MSEEPAPVEEDEFKCYIGRVPTKFNEEIVKRNLVDALKKKENDSEKEEIVTKVELIYPHEDDDGNHTNNNYNYGNDGYREDRNKSTPENNIGDNETTEKEHRGFGFISFASQDYLDAALALQTIKGKRKVTSKKTYSMYVRPYVAKSVQDQLEATDESTNSTARRDVCYLWSLKRCPYGDDCKFRHVGDGACLAKEADLTPEEQKLLQRRRKGKCFAYKTKGKCDKGDDCPFSHDFEPETICKVVPNRSDAQKDCINWRTKGKCRKGDKCPYKHDPILQQKALDKIAKKKRIREGLPEPDTKKRRKEKQPLSVRVFGLNYDTTEADVREFIQQTCEHPITNIVFPRFEDSGRSKGYCGIYFASPKAAAACVEKCDNAELHGRWLRVQTGKSMTIEAWEGLHKK